MSFDSTTKKLAGSLALVLAVGMTCGCSGGLYSTADVTGEVTCNGKPAVGAVLVFEPVDDPEATGRPSGEPGTTSRAVVKEDGTVTLMTDARGTEKSRAGALIGPHRVTVLPPRTTPLTMSPQDKWLSQEDQQALKAELAKTPVFAPLECGTKVQPDQVDVDPGSNHFTFTLTGTPVKPRTAPQRGASD